MSGEDLQRQTSINIQEKANLIWAIADKLVGLYAVIKMNEELEAKGIAVKKGFLEAAAKQKFYNTSKFTFDILLADADNIKDNFENYLNHFSENVIDIINRMDFYNEIKKMDDNNRLYLVIKEFCSAKAYLGADVVSAVDMGYIFEELVRKFSESYNDQAGAHFTARDIIYLMSELLVGEDEQKMEDKPKSHATVRNSIRRRMVLPKPICLSRAVMQTICALEILLATTSSKAISSTISYQTLLSASTGKHPRNV